jgi:hypothetical protein
MFVAPGVSTSDLYCNTIPKGSKIAKKSLESSATADPSIFLNLHYGCGWGVSWTAKDQVSVVSCNNRLNISIYSTVLLVKYW